MRERWLCRGDASYGAFGGLHNHAGRRPYSVLGWDNHLATLSTPVRQDNAEQAMCLM